MFRTDPLSIIRSLNTVYTAIGICHISHVQCLLARSGWSSSLADSQHNQYDKYLLLCIQCWDSWWWTVDLPETCRALYQNKFEKLCISLAFIIRIYIYIYIHTRSKYTCMYLCVTVCYWSHSSNNMSARFCIKTRCVLYTTVCMLLYTASLKTCSVIDMGFCCLSYETHF
jgi:hypothetical protein